MVDWFFRMLKGALIGTGAILPGISGGVLMVVLGVYRPIMAFLAHPVRTFRTAIPFLFPLLIGWAVGVVGLANVVEWLFSEWKLSAIWLFIGLVAGTVPSLYREAGTEGRSLLAWAAFAGAAILIGVWMFILSSSNELSPTPNVLWWALCGILWGLGMVVPGLSPSAFFIFFGLYQPMTEGIGHLDVSVLLPLCVGLIATVALLARSMNHLLQKAYAVVMHGILGIVVASTIGIVPFQSLVDLGATLHYGLCFAAGAVIVYAMDRIGKKQAESGKEI